MNMTKLWLKYDHAILFVILISLTAALHACCSKEVDTRPTVTQAEPEYIQSEVVRFESSRHGKGLLEIVPFEVDGMRYAAVTMYGSDDHYVINLSLDSSLLMKTGRAVSDVRSDWERTRLENSAH